MACLPITDSASVGAPYYASGGGGGGGTPNPSFSTITLPDGTVTGNGANFSVSNQSTIVLFSDSSTFPGLRPTFNAILANGQPNVNNLGANLIAGGIGLIGQAGQYSSQTPAFINGNGTGSVMVSSILVSSINGAAPGGSGFVSTFSIPLPIGTSTTLMTLSPGTWAYNGVALFSGATEPLNGFANTLLNVSQGVYYGSLFANSNSQPAAGVVPCEMTLNFGDSGLSTIKLICANNSGSLAGTWVGAVSKLN